MIQIKHKKTGEVLHTVEADMLSRAHLIGADLFGADLFGTYLSGADLNNTNLHGANLSSAYLDGTDLSKAKLGDTIFANCPTLHLAKGLETIVHTQASSLDARTLRACVNKLPDIFLRGVGYNQEEIETLRAMYAGGGIKYYSCFISYAHLDGLFAERLHNDLEANGVVCWKDTYDMKGGDYYRKQIGEAIKVHDKLILICSKRSTVRPAVIEEIVETMELQQKTGTMKLFPIRLDNFLFSEEMKALAKDRTATGDWPTNWIAKICAFHVPDFSKWKQPDAYQTALQTLLRDLKQTPSS